MPAGPNKKKKNKVRAVTPAIDPRPPKRPKPAKKKIERVK